MKYIKNNTITTKPIIANVINPSHSIILENGWFEYIDNPPTYAPNYQKLQRGEVINGVVHYNVIDLTDREIALQQWEGGDLELKVIAPIELVLTEFGIKMKGWFELLGLPIIPKGDKVHLYCAKIDDQFKATVDDLVSKNVLKIENRPK
jgi:hypothetical protein